MDFDQLETFLEVARHASFSRAAEKRFRTQPAISSQIRGRRGRGRCQAVRPLRRQSFADGGGQGVSEVRRRNARCAQGHAGGDRRDGARAARRNHCGRKRGHVPPHPALCFCRLQEAVSRRVGEHQARRLRQDSRIDSRQLRGLRRHLPSRDGHAADRRANPSG